MKKKRPGRPVLPPGKARNETVRVRLTVGELERIKKAAEEKAVTVSEWSRRRLLDGL